MPDADEPDLAGVGLAPEATDVLRAVLTGDMEPLEGATRLAGGWGPVETPGWEEDELGEGSGPPAFLSLYAIVFELLDGGRTESARRLAELQWYAAQRIGVEDLVVACAAHLAQTLREDPGASRWRLELLEFAVPEILAWDRPPVGKAILLHQLAVTRQAEAGDDPQALRAAIAACHQALSLAAGLDDGLCGELHYVAGATYTTLADAGGDETRSAADDYREAIRHLHEAVALRHPMEDPNAHANTLVILGDAYLGLGRLTGDEDPLRAAADHYRQALAHQDEEPRRSMAERGIAEAERALRGPSASDNGATARSSPLLRSLRGLFREGDAAFTASQSADERAGAHRLRAMEKYLAAAERIGRTEPPELHAEAYHRMSVLMLSSADEDELWTGVCFASAARRLGQGDWQPSSIARTEYHLALMLMKIGMMDGPEQLRTASGLMKAALPVLVADGVTGEGHQVAEHYRSCTTLLAGHGDEEARATALELHGIRQRARIEQELSQALDDPLEAAYGAYLRAVWEEAGSGLLALLAEGEVERVAALVRHGMGIEAAFRLIEEARRRKEAGDLTGALDLADEAGRCADVANVAVPLPWCELAVLCADMALPVQAQTCLDRARAAMETAVDPDDPDGTYEPGVNWFAVMGLEHYRERIEEAAAAVRGTAAAAQFDPAVTARLIRPDEPASGALERALRGRLRQEEGKA